MLIRSMLNKIRSWRERRRRRKKAIELFTFLREVEEGYAKFIKEEEKREDSLKPIEFTLDLVVEEASSIGIEGGVYVLKAGRVRNKRNVHTIKIVLVPREKEKK